MLEASEIIPHQVIGYLAEQLDLSPLEIESYAIREETRREHLIELRINYGFQMYSGDIAQRMRKWAMQKSHKTANAEQLLREFVQECRDRQIILPRITTITRLCSDVMVSAERDAEAAILKGLSFNDCERLETLLQEQIDGHLSRFIWLRQFEVGNNSADVNRLLDRLEFLQSLNLNRNILQEIPPHHIIRLRRFGERYFAHGLKDISRPRRLAILAVCSIEWQYTISDAIIDSHDRIVGRTWREAQRVCGEKLETHKQDIDKTLKGLSGIGRDLLHARKKQQSLEEAISWKSFENLLNAAKNLTSTTCSYPIHFVAHGYHRFRRYAQRMLELLEIKATPVAIELLNALHSIRIGKQHNQNLSFLKRGSKWRTPLKVQKNDKLWEVSVLFHMRDAFRARELWLTGSKQYQELTKSLVPLTVVKTTSQIIVPESPHEWIDEQKKSFI